MFIGVYKYVPGLDHLMRDPLCSFKLSLQSPVLIVHSPNCILKRSNQIMRIGDNSDFKLVVHL